MTPAFWGLFTALSWGCADFIARFTGRGVGHHAALFAMLLVSAIIFSGIILFTGTPLIWSRAGLGLLILTGTGAMVATLLLYWGLTRGPVSVVAPIAGSYPVLNILYAVIGGTMPSVTQWLAMGGVMGGVYLVARSIRNFSDRPEYTPPEHRKTVLISIAAAFSFGVTVIALQEAGRIYGELQTVFLARWISLLAIVLVLVWRRKAIKIPGRWWPLIGLQGLLDGGAFLGLVIGGQSTGGEIAAVVASAFSAVTVILARLILKESMSTGQWGGIVVIIAGVGVLMMP